MSGRKGPGRPRKQPWTSVGKTQEEIAKHYIDEEERKSEKDRIKYESMRDTIAAFNRINATILTNMHMIPDPDKHFFKEERVGEDIKTMAKLNTELLEWFYKLYDSR